MTINNERTGEQVVEGEALGAAPASNAVDVVETTENQVKEEPEPVKFAALQLHPGLKKAIDKLGFKTATPIQSQILPLTLRGQDAIGRAQTGTGKTAAFLLTIINDLLNNPLPKDEPRYRGEPRALILAPTRELAQQIKKDCDGLVKYTDLHVLCLLGGVDFDKQYRQLNKAFVDIIVATPGRLLDFVNRKDVWLDRIELFVLDEADRMLDMGFIPDIKRIIRAMPPNTDRQSLLFSATFNQDVMNLAYRWLYQPEYIEVEPEQKTAKLVEQIMYLVSNDDKPKLLRQILGQKDTQKVIIFANRRHQVRDIYLELKHEKYPVAMLSGEMTQAKRESHLNRFKGGDASIMVATDVAGRGIHVDDVSHVVNYTLPDQCDDYVHRIGRTGRAGAKGVSISFVSEDDAFVLPALEVHLDRKFNLLQPDLS